MTTEPATSTSHGKRRGGDGRAIIEAAALRTFYARGYYGTSIRDIAAGANMTAASLYHHFTGKQDILCAVMTQIMREALRTTRSALLRAGGTPADQLTGLVRAWVEFHAQRQVEARVGSAELNSLEPGGRQLVVALRDEQEQMFREVVHHGVEKGVFQTPHALEAARAIIAMGTAVSTWYRPDGATTPQGLAETYADLALAIVQSKAGPAPLRAGPATGR
jgi:AcrR family transcriptional regulator